MLKITRSTLFFFAVLFATIHFTTVHQVSTMQLSILQLWTYPYHGILHFQHSAAWKTVDRLTSWVSISLLQSYFFKDSRHIHNTRKKNSQFFFFQVGNSKYTISIQKKPIIHPLHSYEQY